MGRLGDGLALHLLVSTHSPNHANVGTHGHIDCLKIEHGVARGPVPGIRPIGCTDLEKRLGHALAIPAIVLASWKEEERSVQQGQHVGWCRWSFLSAADALI